LVRERCLHLHSLSGLNGERKERKKKEVKGAKPIRLHAGRRRGREEGKGLGEENRSFHIGQEKKEPAGNRQPLHFQ